MAGHEALSLRNVDGWFQVVECSCSNVRRPTTHVWVAEHFEGSDDDGWAVLQALLERQRDARRIDPEGGA